MDLGPQPFLDIFMIVVIFAYAGTLSYFCHRLGVWLWHRYDPKEIAVDPLPTEDEIAKILYENNYNANRPWDKAIVPYKDYAIRDARAVLAFITRRNQGVCNE